MNIDSGWRIIYLNILHTLYCRLTQKILTQTHLIIFEYFTHVVLHVMVNDKNINKNTFNYIISIKKKDTKYICLKCQVRLICE